MKDNVLEIIKYMKKVFVISVREMSFFDYIKKRNKAVPFIIFSSFIITFIITRSFVIFHPNMWVVLNGYHIHHFVFGAVLIFIAGFLSLNYPNKHVIYFSSALYGIGLGVFADEIGLIITWEDYWSNITYDVIILLSSFFLLFIFLRDFLSIFGSKIQKIFGKETYVLIKNISKTTLNKENFLIGYSMFIIALGILLFAFLPEHIHYWLLLVSASLLSIIILWFILKIFEKNKQK